VIEVASSRRHRKTRPLSTVTGADGFSRETAALPPAALRSRAISATIRLPDFTSGRWR
jgi:hypothetical protein